MTCAWFEMLSCIPFAGLRLRLCEWHVDKCMRCQQASESGETLRPILVSATQLPGSLDLWPRVQEGIASLPTSVAGSEVIPLPKRRTLRWAYAAAMAVLLLVAGFWVFFSGRHPGSQPGPVVERPAVQTRVCSASIEDRPARVFLIQSRNPNRSIFWIAKTNSRS